jgi:hypothetical protein
MPMARDIFHKAVKNALVKDGWTITHDPYELAVGGVEMYIDLGAEQLIGAEREDKKIAVEIKSFTTPSLIYEFHTAHGQFLDYRYALEEEDPKRVLYLAVPDKIYTVFFSLKFIQNVVERSQLRLLIYNPNEETIVLWQ